MAAVTPGGTAGLWAEAEARAEADPSRLDGRRPRQRLSGRAKTVSARTGQALGPMRHASARGKKPTAYLTTPSILGRPLHLRRALVGTSGRPPGGSQPGNGSLLGRVRFQVRWRFG